MSEHINAVALSLLKDHIESDKTFIFEVSSNYSMRPFLRVGDQIVTSKLVLKDLSLGDLVICKLSSHLYIHRFLYRYGPFFITKGDNLPYIDMPLLSERLIGKAIAVRRCGKEMHLDNIVWRITNHILGAVSMLEAYTVKILRFIKRTLISP